MNWFLKLILRTILVIFIAYILPGVEIGSVWSALGVAIVLALLNTFLKPLLIIITIPFTILTLGLFLLVINAGIIMLADAMISGFMVDDFWWALLFSLVLSFVSSLFEGSSKKENI
jgi:putative membrane protein